MALILSLVSGWIFSVRHTKRNPSGRTSLQHPICFDSCACTFLGPGFQISPGCAACGRLSS